MLVIKNIILWAEQLGCYGPSSSRVGGRIFPCQTLFRVKLQSCHSPTESNPNKVSVRMAGSRSQTLLPPPMQSQRCQPLVHGSWVKKCYLY